MELYFIDSPAKKAARQIVETLQSFHHEAFVIGGGVRDRLLGRTPKDFDVVTSATPDQVCSIFPTRSKLIGAKFGVVQIWEPRNDDDWPLVTTEVATYRTESGYKDHRHPTEVRFAKTLKEDVERRDFTMNGIAVNPITGDVTDLVNGMHDVQQRVIRCIGAPRDRFEEDALRMLRAVRFAVQLGFQIHYTTWASICNSSYLITEISKERVKEELFKMLASNDPSRAMFLLNQCGLLKHLFGESISSQLDKTLRRLQQIGWITHDPLNRLLVFSEALKFDKSGELDNFASALVLSGDEFEKLLSGRRVTRHLQALMDSGSMQRADAIRIMRKPGAEMALHYLSAMTVIEDGRAYKTWVEFRKKLLNVDSSEILHPKPFITGDDLIARGYRPGPGFKNILFNMETLQLNQTVTSIEEALKALPDVVLREELASI
jgi:poly(A) polymerase